MRFELVVRQDRAIELDLGLVREAAELVTLCRDKIQAAEVQVKTITEQLERDADDPADTEDTPTT